MKVGRAVVAALLAWTAFAVLLDVILLHALPLLGAQEVDVPGMLGGVFGWNSTVLGWGLLFIAGIAFALLYACWGVDRLPGPGWQRGLLFGSLPWLVMMAIVAPLLPLLDQDMPDAMIPGFFFSKMGSAAAIGDLLVCLGWGAALGTIYGNVAGRRINAALASAVVVPVFAVSVIAVAHSLQARTMSVQDGCVGRSMGLSRTGGSIAFWRPPSPCPPLPCLSRRWRGHCTPGS